MQSEARTSAISIRKAAAPPSDGIDASLSALTIVGWSEQCTLTRSPAIPVQTMRRERCCRCPHRVRESRFGAWWCRCSPHHGLAGRTSRDWARTTDLPLAADRDCRHVRLPTAMDWSAAPALLPPYPPEPPQLPQSSAARHTCISPHGSPEQDPGVTGTSGQPSCRGRVGWTRLWLYRRPARTSGIGFQSNPGHHGYGGKC
jgi:hypothetical protein